jgi:hypothetical protein
MVVINLLYNQLLFYFQDEQFDKILSTFCKHKKLKKEEVILSYKEDKVFLRGTPAGIGMVGPETRTMCKCLFIQKTKKEANDFFRCLSCASMGRETKERRNKIK